MLRASKPAQMFSPGERCYRRVDELAQANADFIVETTLATLAYAQKIPAWRTKGYVVSLVYLRLGSPEEAIMRVRKRVAAGGHNISGKTASSPFRKEPHALKRFTSLSSTNGIYGKAERARSHSSKPGPKPAMSRGLDIRKAEAALKRAAHKAVHGTREERSGRVLLPRSVSVKYDAVSGDRTNPLWNCARIVIQTFPRMFMRRFLTKLKGAFFNALIRDRYSYRELA